MLLSQINYHLKQLQEQCTVKRDPAAFHPPMLPIVDRSKSLVVKPVTKLAKAKAARAARTVQSNITLVPPPPADLDIPSQAVVAKAQEPLEVFAVPVIEEPLNQGLEPDLAPLEDIEEPITQLLPPEPAPQIPIYELAEIKPEPFDLLNIFEQYVPKSKGEKMSFKTMGLPVPTELHERMAKFLAEHKGKPGSPQSLRDLGLMCLGFAMDELQAGQEEDVAL